MDLMTVSLSELDPDIYTCIQGELARQQEGLEMIASENFVPNAVLQATGSILTNKYAEGYPSKRYYGGCEWVDKVEELAIARARTLFGAEFANVQPHSGAQANAAVYQALLKPGDTVLGLALDHGGHLTHGMRLNFSGKFYHAEAYTVDPKTMLIEPELVRKRALEVRPQMIIGGWSAYSRIVDFKALRDIADEVGAKLWVDMAHFAGMVAAGLHPSPVPVADVVSSTVHKTLGGPRSGFILAREQYAKAINSAVFPGQQGGPLMHVIAAKAVAFKLAATPEFRERMQRALEGAKIIAARLMQPDVKDAGVAVLTGGTDVHLVMVDLRESSMTGMDAQELLARIGITVNRNTVPFDPRPASISSGVRIGTSALATRGFTAADFEEIAEIIALALKGELAHQEQALAARVSKLATAHTLYEQL